MHAIDRLNERFGVHPRDCEECSGADAGIVRMLSEAAENHPAVPDELRGRLEATIPAAARGFHTAQPFALGRKAALRCAVVGTAAAAVLAIAVFVPDEVERIEAAHAARARALRTVELQERVVTRIETVPGELDKFFDSQMEAVARLVEMAQTKSEHVQKQLAPQIEQLLESVDPTMLIIQLNKKLDIRRKSIIDFVNGRSRHEDIDLRPIDKLAEQYGLTEMQRWSLNKSSTLIQKRGESILLMSHVDRLAILGAYGEYGAEMERLKFGLIPERMFDSERYQLSVESDSGGSTVRLVGRTGGADASPRFVAILERGSGFLMTRFTTFDDSGATMWEWAWSDYRPVGSVMVPFRSVRTSPRGDIRDYFVQERTVEQVNVNVDVDDASFEIPADYRIQDLRMSKIAAGERSKPQPQSPAISETDEAKKGDDETRQQVLERGSGSADGQKEARAIPEGTEDEAPGRTIVRSRRADEGEWERYTREFVARFKLDDQQHNAARRILRDCQEQRGRYLASKRERIDQLQKRLSANESDKADRLLREFENARRELKELKRPVVKIFEKQLKPRLDKLPTRAQRAAAEKTGKHNAADERKSDAGGGP
ncbi:MAG: hypothetical protein IID33_09820 [Planctomycetes bacterium]|nr:hypothetical protein [Planctomycetota bacterium]